MRKLYLLISILVCSVVLNVHGQVTITGELKKWHKVTLDVEGMPISERDALNPFRDYRFNVTFSNGSKSYLVPGYFAADGNAAETSADSGSVWRAHFSPDELGIWNYSVSFRTGTDIAISDDSLAGAPVVGLNGLTGTFSIEPSDKTGNDFRAKGRLQYIGEHYLRFAETGQYFLKGGTNSPENLLAYEDFDNTYSDGGITSLIHSYSPHVNDWDTVNPSWQGGRGKGIIGALNYLAGQGINAQYFITNTIDGDGDDVWPYISPDTLDRFDVSKLDQWEIVFAHMDSLGIMQHFVLSERENQTLLDDGAVGTYRKLYFRELIARFSHHLGVAWNLGEENGYEFLNRGVQSDQERKDMASYFKQHDPYTNFVTIHHFTNDDELIYDPLLGYPDFDGTSIQIFSNSVHDYTIKWIDNSVANGKKWVVNHDETNNGVSSNGGGNNHATIREEVLWGNLMAGGGGVELYFGYPGDLEQEDFSDRSDMYEFAEIAIDFFQDHVPFWKMKHNDDLVSQWNAYCFAKPGHTYVIYLPSGGSTNIDLACGQYSVHWFDPRNGGALQTTGITQLNGNGSRDTGNPPSQTSEDWVVLIRNNYQIDFSVTEAGCNGDDGSISISINGGTAPYTYVWSNGDTSATINNLATGAYSVTVTDDNGCSISDYVELGQSLSYETYQLLSICENDSIFLQGAWQNTLGTYFDTLVAATGCDSVIISDLLLLTQPISNQSVSICQGESFFTEGLNQTSSGTYYDTLQASNSCDSVIVTNLTVKPTFSTNVSVEICNGESYFVGGGDQTVSGTYYDTLTAVNGCDSVIVTALTVKPTYSTNQSISICQGESFFIEGLNQTSSGTYYDTLQASNSCDSVIITNLTVQPTFTSNIAIEICSGESYFIGGGDQTVSGTYYDTLVAVNGCDSVIVTALTVKPTYSTNQSISICQGESFFIEGLNQTSSGTYYDTLQASNGCDSVIITNLIVKPTFSTNVSVEICNGESYFVGGGDQTVSGTYYDTLVAVNGCDSVIVTALTVKPTYSTNQSISICQGESFFTEGLNQTSSGTYYDTLQASNSCDSVIITNLTVQPTFTSNIAIEICSGESYFVGGGDQTVSGTYYDTLTAVNGCDSVIVTDLLVKQHTFSLVFAAICEGESLYAGGGYQYNTGTYYDTLLASNGCDSVIQTELEVIPTTLTINEAEVCQGDSIMIQGVYKTSPGIYYDTLASSTGCDSIIETVLSQIPDLTTFQAISICEGDSVLLEGQYRKSNGVYRDSLISSSGCDSTIITSLSVKELKSSVQSYEICASDSLYLEGQWRKQAGVYYDTVIGSNACDSIVVSILTVNPVFEIIRNISICSGDSFYAGGNYQEVSGTYFDSLQSFSNCDSVIITNLIVNPSYLDTAYVSICEDESYFVEGAFRSSAGVYVDSFLTIEGCDSVIVTELDILSTALLNRTISICAGDSVLLEQAWQNSSGTYYDTLVGINGCDSIIETELFVNPNYNTSVIHSLCEQDSLFVGGAWQYSDGIYYDTLSTVNSCDSVIATTIVIEATIHTNVTISVCQGDSIFAGSSWQMSEGVFYDTLNAFGGCDSVIITEVDIIPIEVVSDTVSICSGDSIFLGGSFRLSEGQYPDTITSSTGCDSIVVWDVIVLPEPLTFVDTSICYGEVYHAGGANQSVSGIYFDTLMTYSACDSVVITNLTVRDLISTSISVDICSGESYLAGGMLRTSAGTYHDTLSAANGCDSIVATILNVLDHSSNFINVQICEGESYFAGGVMQTTSGVYFDTLLSANGCDSVLITSLSIKQHVTEIISVEICSNQSYYAGGALQSSPGVYRDTLEAFNGCDSIVLTNLSVVPAFLFNRSVELCEGDSIFLQGDYRNRDGIFLDTFVALNGCDSIIVTDLIVWPDKYSTISAEICEGDNFILNGTPYSNTGTYFDTLPTTYGCDSIIELELLVVPHLYHYDSLFICQGQSAYVAGEDRFVSGIYYDTLSASIGCDSIVVTSLGVVPQTVTNVSLTICENDDVLLGGELTNTPGIYYDTVESSLGCDSILVTQLSVSEVTSSLNEVTICMGETYFVGGSNQTSSGVYFDTLSSSLDCDSVVITILDVIDPMTTLRGISICDGESYFVGGAAQTTGGVYYDTLINRFGCDSIIATSLAILDHAGSIVEMQVCTGDSVLIGTDFKDTTGIYYDTLIAENGCDSVVTTSLTVLDIILQNQDVEICQGENYFIGGGLQTGTGTYYDTLTASSGCDSVLITQLQVLPNSAEHINLEICLGDSAFLSGNWTTSAGTYIDTLQRRTTGCDSILTTQLSFSNVLQTSIVAAICNGDSVWAGGQWRTRRGVYFDTLIAAGGCDSIVTTNIQVFPTYLQGRTVTTCDNEPYFVGGAWRVSPGTYNDTLTSINGCDSIVQTNLQILPITVTSVYEEICEDQALFFGGDYRDSSGIYYDTLHRSNGCDSVIELSLNILARSYYDTTVSFCQGDSVFVGSSYQNTSGSYEDTLIALNGCDSVVRYNLIVHATPQASIAGDTEICEGEIVVLNAFGGVNYAWSTGDFAQTSVSYPQQSTTFSVTVTNQFGCSDDDSVFVLVREEPVASISGLQASYCKGDTVVDLVGLPSGGVFTGSIVDQNGQFDPSSAGQFPIQYDFTDPYGCSTTVTRQVQIYATPSVDFIGLDSSYCDIDQAFSLLPVPQGGAFSGSGISGASFNPHDATSGTHAITYDFTNQFGCSASLAKNVTVYDLPDVTIELIDTNFCVDDSSITLIGTPNSGVFSGVGVMDSIFMPSLAGIGGPYLFTYEVIDSNGCTAKAEKEVFVFGKPQVSFAGLDPQYCTTDDPVALDGSPRGGSFVGNAMVDTMFEPSLATVGTSTVVYQYTSEYGCYNKVTQDVSIIPAPEAEIAGLDEDYCVDGPLVFMNGVPSGGQFIGQGLTVNVFDPEDAGAGGPYPIIYKVIGNNGCHSVDSQYVMVHPRPQLDIVGIDEDVCLSASPIEVTGTPEGGVFQGAGMDDNMFYSSHAGLGSHLIFYSYTDSNDCSNTKKVPVQVTICSSVEDNEVLPNISTYPNPFEDEVNVTVVLELQTHLNWRLINALGEILKTESYELNSGTHDIAINTKALSSGIYFIEFTAEGISYSNKMIKK